MDVNQVQGLHDLTRTASFQVIAVTSGKGGVGKTNVSVNLAIGLSSLGRSVMLFDADLGLANVDVTLGLKPKYDVRHVISGERTLEEVLVTGPGGIRIIPAASGVSAMAQLSPHEHAGLIRAFSDMVVPLDTLIVDTGAGIDASVLNFTSACQQVIVVVCDEPTSLTDAYALIKVLNKEHGVKEFQILVNMVENDFQGRQLFEKLCRVNDRFLNTQLHYLGAVPYDNYLKKAVQSQTAVIKGYPRSASAKSFKKISSYVDKHFGDSQSVGSLGFFIERVVQGGPNGST